MRRDCSHRRSRLRFLHTASGCGYALDIHGLLGNPEVEPSQVGSHLITSLPETSFAEAIKTAWLPCVAGHPA